MQNEKRNGENGGLAGHWHNLQLYLNIEYSLHITHIDQSPLAC